ncbi:MAG: PAS domain S-box protein [Verrucomicrobiota bacterium]|nr:PAS domain S-box protein [Verrucomicrobiota bacterium]
MSTHNPEVAALQRRIHELEDELQHVRHGLRHRKAAQTAELLARDAEILARIPDAVIVTDRESNITYWNTAAEAIYGCKAEELLGKPLTARLPPDAPDSDHQAIRDTFARVMKGEIIEQEVLDYHSNGSRFWTSKHFQRMLDSEGQTTGAIGIVTDISGRKRAEAEIRRFFTAIEQCPIAIEITDPGGTIIYVNPTYCTTSGYAIEDVVGRNLSILSPEDTPQSIYHELWASVSAGIKWQGDLISKRKDGTLYTERTVISPITDELGRITNFLGIKEDVTNRIQAQEQLKQLEAELRQAQKMETIGTLAGGIAHDYNNILTAIFGYTELAQRHVEKNSPAYNDMDKVLLSARRARELTRQILTFSRREERRVNPIKFTTVLTDAVSLLRAVTPSTIAISTAINCRQDTVLGDSTQLQQVIVNLGTNAVHAMKAHGTKLEFTLDDVLLNADADIRLSKLPAGPYLKLAVRDEGTGMSPELLKRIFDPFFTTKSVGEGTGLGLSVVMGIILSHSGQILVDSTEGGGSVFQVFLPITTLTEKPDHGDQLTPEGGSESILLIEDEEPILQAQSSLLTRLGYKVTPCISAIQAINEFERNPERFHLIITDQTMPGMTGIELVAKIRNKRDDIPIIVTSGYSQALTPEVKNQLNIYAFVDKPFNAGRLDRTIRQACESFSRKGLTSAKPIEKP